ncbi:hypothetical protein BDZ31_003520 [Conexibacter arvalis]|uniref:Uncharacterized protein n=1 Tax=Conexibacter arvalis TaxID=912552 RepID=A0A840IGK8_9ACTN|nr:hypothetical protein [Conexibacter arvalis]
MGAVAGGLQRPLDLVAHEPHRPPEPSARQDPAPRELVDGRYRQFEQLGDLSRGHHVSPREAGA